MTTRLSNSPYSYRSILYFANAAILGVDSSLSIVLSLFCHIRLSQPTTSLPPISLNCIFLFILLSFLLSSLNELSSSPPAGPLASQGLHTRKLSGRYLAWNWFDTSRVTWC